jgi:hypothetical protein
MSLLTAITARARAARWRAWQRWAGHPSYLRVAGRRRGRAVVGPGTELVIEGFPRTASTFAVFAFQTAQPRPVRVAHHLHAPAQIIAAARLGIPALVLIRPPEDAVISILMWWPQVTPRDALAAYARFYERTLPSRDRCVVGRFAEVTSDLGAVIDRVNRRFGTDFASFVHTPENVEHCYRLIEERSLRPADDDAINAYLSGAITAAQLEVARRARPQTASTPSETRVARPSVVRDAVRDSARAAYLDPRLAKARSRAESVYRDFVGE